MISTDRILLSLGIRNWERDEQNCAKIYQIYWINSIQPIFLKCFNDGEAMLRCLKRFSWKLVVDLQN